MGLSDNFRGYAPKLGIAPEIISVEPEGHSLSVHLAAQRNPIFTQVENFERQDEKLNEDANEN